MRAARRHRFLIAGAALLIAAAASFYAVLVYDWLRGGRAAARPRPPRADANLRQARSDFRAGFLHPAAHLHLAEALHRSGRHIDAFYVMHGARTFFPEEAFTRAHALVVLYQGRHFLGETEFDPSPESERRLKARLQQSPQDPDLLNYSAHICAARGRGKEAVALLEAGLAAHPEDRGLLSYRAQLAAGAGDWSSAVTTWARLAAAHPEAFETRGALEELGRLAQRKPAASGGEEGQLAREALEDLFRRRPDDPQVFSTLAMAVWGREDVAAVRALVTETLARRPGHAGTAMVSGALALYDREVDQAIRWFTEAWEKNPNDLYSAAKLAQIYFKQRADREAALPFYLALYRANPRYDDGEPAQVRIRQTLDMRREHLLKYAQADTLGRFLSCEDASLRAEACVKASQFKDPRWIETLAELLDDDTEIVRHNADYALYQIAKVSPDAVRVRRDEWIAADKPLLRARALNLFADLEPRETLPLVLRALYDPHPAARYLVRVMVLDHYYQGFPQAAKARAEYLAWEKDVAVRARYARLSAKP